MLFRFSFSLLFNAYILTCDRQTSDFCHLHGITFIFLSGKCQSDEYECKNHRCIDQDLNCSPKASNPCGDWSNCVKKPPLSGISCNILTSASNVCDTWILKRNLFSCPQDVREAGVSRINTPLHFRYLQQVQMPIHIAFPPD